MDVNMIISKLLFGSTFLFNNEMYILSQDCNRKNQRNCISLNNGSSKWIDEQTEVAPAPVYTLDDKNNFIPLKEDGKYELVQN